MQVCVYMCIYRSVFYLHTFTSVDTHVHIQDGEDPQDALNCRLFSANEPLIIGLFCGKRHVKTSHPLGLRHPVR